MTALTERWLQEQVRALCADLGLPVQHLEDSRRSWLPGWPDLVIFRGHRPPLWRELKDAHNTVSPDQRRVGAIITAGGGDWAVWRPADLLSGRIARELNQ